MRGRDLSILLLFVVSAFLGASLLFLSEPMIGKLLLPLFGGSSAVWNTAIVFFQAMLLAGYAYAHWSVKHIGLKHQPWLHGILLLLPLLVLPFTLPLWAFTNSGGASDPVALIVVIMAATVGLPFLMLSTVGPLLQYWFSATSHPRASRPYFLYAAGNLGSFAALLSYPFLVEPHLTLKEQSTVWAIIYGLFVATMIGCITVLYKFKSRPVTKRQTKKQTPPSWYQRATWLFFAFLPSSLMLGVTTFITTDIASAPLFWILPLALYLLSFVVAFGINNPKRMVSMLLPITAGFLALSSIDVLPLNIPTNLQIILYLVLFTLIALVAHGRLAIMRPDPIYLTEFYLWLAIGGVAGGIINGLVAPLIFNNVYEFQLVLILSLAILFFGVKKLFHSVSPRKIVITMTLSLIFFIVVLTLAMLPEESPPRIIAFSIIVLFASGYILQRYRLSWLLVILVPILSLPTILMASRVSVLTERTFYGVIRVEESDGRRIMYHGTTSHGEQALTKKDSTTPTSYYHPSGPLGDAMKACRLLTGCRDMGIIGLGTGTVAAYGQRGDALVFYEIDPAIARIANDPQYFTYLSDTEANVETIVGDGRLALDRGSDRYDILVVDAFSSDAIPVHLLTAEALSLYRTHLTEKGIILLHISNRNLKLEPVVEALARTQNLHATMRYDDPKTYDSTHYPSQWVAIAQNKDTLVPLYSTEGWRTLEGKNLRAWTDDYSNVTDALFY